MSTLKDTAVLALAAVLLDLEPAEVNPPCPPGGSGLSDHYLKLLEDTSGLQSVPLAKEGLPDAAPADLADGRADGLAAGLFDGLAAGLDQAAKNKA